MRRRPLDAVSFCMMSVYRFPVATHGLQDLAHERRFRAPEELFDAAASESNKMAYLDAQSDLPDVVQPDRSYRGAV